VGGKSRKTGGVSKALIDKIKQGGGRLPASKPNKGQKPKDAPNRPDAGFDLGDE